MRYLKSICAAFCMALLPAHAQAAPPPFVTPTFLLPYASDALLYDYRPAINEAGTRFVFERSYTGTGGVEGYSGVINLWIADLTSPPSFANLLLPTSAPHTPKYPGSNRPDWCWLGNPSTDGPIVFSAGATGGVPASPLSGVYYTPSNPQTGTSYTFVPNSTAKMSYPTWFPGCAQIAVYVGDALVHNGLAGPQTQKLGIDGTQFPTLSGSRLWAGFPSVNPKQPQLLALAAQQFNVSPNGYDQDLNYIYVSDTSASPPRVKPYDPRAPVNRYAPRFEGRAATWSPDGRWIAFESNRNCNGSFAIFLQDMKDLAPARQVTDCSYNTQHAKWFSKPVNGRRLLIVSARLYHTYNGSDAPMRNAMGIASLDITDFLH